MIFDSKQDLIIFPPWPIFLGVDKICFFFPFISFFIGNHIFLLVCIPFLEIVFLASYKIRQNDESRARYKRERKTSTDLKPRPLRPSKRVSRYLVWTVPAALADSWPDIGPLPCCWVQLSLFKRGGVILRSYDVTGWWVDASRKRNAGTPSGVNPRGPLGLESDLGPVRDEWLYHDDNVGTQSQGCMHPST